jgi:CRISPR-associated protein Csx3
MVDVDKFSTGKLSVVYWDIGVGSPISPDTPLPPMPVIPPGALVVVGGRSPIWRYGRALHAVHGRAAAVAVYDPRLGGGVIVASHHPGFAEGMIVPTPDSPWAEN